MPSPFPGMDPYLEPHWPDVHLSLISFGRGAINRALPTGLVARGEERVAVEDGREGTFVPLRPDVRVFARPGRESGPDDATVVIDAPYELRATGDPPVERFLRILDADGQLLTVVEILSPANKREPGLTEFRRKRSELLSAGVHFVEVDLVRAGNWRSLMAPSRCPRSAASMYRAVVRTAGRGGATYLFPIRLRDPLPDIPVPVRAGVATPMLPLQAILDAAYDESKYGETVNYGRPLDRPLDADDAAWAAALLAARSP